MEPLKEKLEELEKNALFSNNVAYPEGNGWCKPFFLATSSF